MAPAKPNRTLISPKTKAASERIRLSKGNAPLPPTRFDFAQCGSDFGFGQERTAGYPGPRPDLGPQCGRSVQARHPTGRGLDGRFGPNLRHAFRDLEVLR